MKNPCRKARPLLALRAADRSVAEQDFLDAHLQSCPDCAAWERQCREQDALIGGLPLVRPSSLRSQRFLAQIRTIRRQHTMAIRLKPVVSTAGLIAFLVSLLLLVRTVLPGMLPARDVPEVSGVKTVELQPGTLVASSGFDTVMLFTAESPDGQWTAQAHFDAFQEAPEGVACEWPVNVRPEKSDPHVVFTVSRRDGTAQWTAMDGWYCALDYPWPELVGWSQDGQSLFFTRQYSMNALHPTYKDNFGVWRLDLASGQVSEVAVPDGYSHAISPDGSQMAYVSNTELPELVVRDLITGAERRASFADEFSGSQPDSMSAGGIFWPPDAGALFFVAVRGHSTLDELLVSRLDLASMEVLVFIGYAGETPLIFPRQWADGQLLLENLDNGYAWWVDAQTGGAATRNTLASTTPVPPAASAFAQVSLSMSARTWDSPDGRWILQEWLIQGYKAPEGARCEEPGMLLDSQPGRNRHVLLTVLDRDETILWPVIDAWFCGAGYQSPRAFTWSQDGRSFYFSKNFVTNSATTVYRPMGYGLWRVDLTSGQIAKVVVPDGYAHSISPDESRIAYMSRSEPSELVIKEVTTGSEQRVSFWDELFLEAPGTAAEAGDILWSPEGDALFFAAVNGQRYAEDYTVARLDFPSLAVTALVRDESYLIWPQQWSDGQLLVVDQASTARWVDAKTGKVID